MYTFYFAQLTEKKENCASENAKGRIIRYENYNMQDYLTEIIFNLSLDEKRLIFKCRTDNIDLRGNFSWKYKRLLCISCDLSFIDNTEHLLLCTELLGIN